MPQAHLLQDAWFSIGTFDSKQCIKYLMNKKNTGVYIFVLEGDVKINGQILSRRDGIGIWEVENVSIECLSESHIFSYRSFYALTFFNILHRKMDKNRLEAFSDGVLAIIITIMVLSMSTPEETTFVALRPVVPVFVSYLLSFVYIGIYWINHHHILQVAQRIDGKILWANLHLLFWISLIPFTTDWGW